MRATHIAVFILATLAMATCAPMFTTSAASSPQTAVFDFFPQDRISGAAKHSDPSPAETVMDVEGAGATGAFTVKWTYSAYLGGSKLPISGAFVELRRSTTGGYTIEATTFTDEQGYSYFQDVSPGNLEALIFTDDHSTIKVLDGQNYDPYSWDTGWRSHSTSTSVEMNINDADRAAWCAYAAVRTAADWLESQSGYRRESINVNWPDGDWPHSHGDDIDLPDSGEYSDAIWEAATVTHEYGHCVQYAVLGDRFPEGDGPDPHYIYSESSPGFAFSEGWAQFFASAVTGNPNRSGDHTSLESTVYADGAFGYDGDRGDWDGNIVEGAVANVLWDIFDGVNAADHPSYSSVGDLVDQQFPALWTILYDHKIENIDDVWSNWEGKDSALQAVFYNARIKKDMSIPTNPDAFASSHEIGVESDDSTVSVTLVGASDVGGEVAGYSILWDNSPTGMPDTVMDISGSTVTSPVLSSGKDWYLHVRVVDGAGNWASDSYTVGPFLVSQNAVAQGDPLQIPGWLPLLIVLAVICVIVLALFMAAENGRRQRERRAAQMQMQQAQYHYQYQGVYPPPQQPGNVHVTTYHAPICPRCGRVDMGSTYCPYCGWRMR